MTTVKRINSFTRSGVTATPAGNITVTVTIADAVAPMNQAESMSYDNYPPSGSILPEPLRRRPDPVVRKGGIDFDV